MPGLPQIGRFEHVRVRRENQGQHRHLLSHPVAGRTFGNRPIAVKARAVSDPCPAAVKVGSGSTRAEPVVMRTAGIGASLPLDAGVKNEEVCPLSDLRADRFERLSRVEIRHSFRRPEAAIRATAGEPSGYGPFPTHGQA